MGASLWRGVVAPKFKVNYPQISLNRGHDRTTIRPRSWIDHDRYPPRWPSENRGDDSALKESQSRLDRAAIAVRSDRDRGVLPRVFYAVRLESDAPALFRKERKESAFMWPLDRDRAV